MDDEKLRLLAKMPDLLLATKKLDLLHCSFDQPETPPENFPKINDIYISGDMKILYFITGQLVIPTSTTDVSAPWKILSIDLKYINIKDIDTDTVNWSFDSTKEFLSHLGHVTEKAASFAASHWFDVMRGLALIKIKYQPCL